VYVWRDLGRQPDTDIHAIKIVASAVEMVTRRR
jgi:hypothetical protein